MQVKIALSKQINLSYRPVYAVCHKYPWKKKTAQYSHCNRGKYIFFINAKYSFIAGEKYLIFKYLWPIHFYLPLPGGAKS